MDYVLGVTNNLFFDYLYAKAFPLDPASIALNNNGTSYIGGLAHGIELDPFSKLIGVSPSKHAFLSQFPRDDWKRQGFSLFLITW